MNDGELEAAASNEMDPVAVLARPSLVARLVELREFLQREGVDVFAASVPNRVATDACRKFELKSPMSLNWCRALILSVHTANAATSFVATDDGMNDRERRFVDYYVGEANGCKTKAARLAGYASPQSEGSRLYQRERVRTAISQRMRETAVTAEEILARLSLQARASLADFGRVDASGRWVLDLREAEASGKLCLIKKLVVGRGGEVAIELHDPQAALLALAKRIPVPERSACINEVQENQAGALPALNGGEQ